MDHMNVLGEIIRPKIWPWVSYQVVGKCGYDSILIKNKWLLIKYSVNLITAFGEKITTRTHMYIHTAHMYLYIYTNTWIYTHAHILLLLSHFSSVRLCVTPEMAAHQAPPSLGFSRQEHWSGLPFPSPMHESEKWKWSRSVMSDSSRAHGLQPTRLLCPWDFPGKSTGVGCHCLLRSCIHECICIFTHLYMTHTHVCILHLQTH